jgi:bifunctional UDP-N-acetylglucosamine pyrophosphorylase/glucosamine-1-phosphate N-acetyltransferase
LPGKNVTGKNMKNKVAAIILAAGKGERMKSALPKVLHQICSRPMLGYVLDLVKELQVKDFTVVLGYKHEEVKKILEPKTKTALQKKILGTGDAVKQALPNLRAFKGTVVVLYGDTPLLKKETIQKLLDHHLDTKAAATLLVAKLENPSGYGRILRDKYNSLRDRGRKRRRRFSKDYPGDQYRDTLF